jgi:hypothetical protein
MNAPGLSARNLAPKCKTDSHLEGKVLRPAACCNTKIVYRCSCLEELSIRYSRRTPLLKFCSFHLTTLTTKSHLRYPSLRQRNRSRDSGIDKDRIQKLTINRVLLLRRMSQNLEKLHAARCPLQARDILSATWI